MTKGKLLENGRYEHECKACGGTYEAEVNWMPAMSHASRGCPDEMNRLNAEHMRREWRELDKQAARDEEAETLARETEGSLS